MMIAHAKIDGGSETVREGFAEGDMQFGQTFVKFMKLFDDVEKDSTKAQTAEHIFQGTVRTHLIAESSAFHLKYDVS